ncbi:hypothetical protein L1887_60224 [Cichorium endivia]|nr:hypothetical protein L1887_60224 [Cichorium endivia]
MCVSALAHTKAVSETTPRSLEWAAAAYGALGLACGAGELEAFGARFAQLRLAALLRVGLLLGRLLRSLLRVAPNLCPPQTRSAMQSASQRHRLRNEVRLRLTIFQSVLCVRGGAVQRLQRCGRKRPVWKGVSSDIRIHASQPTNNPQYAHTHPHLRLGPVNRPSLQHTHVQLAQLAPLVVMAAAVPVGPIELAEVHDDPAPDGDERLVGVHKRHDGPHEGVGAVADVCREQRYGRLDRRGEIVEHLADDRVDVRLVVEIARKLDVRHHVKLARQDPRDGAGEIRLVLDVVKVDAVDAHARHGLPLGVDHLAVLLDGAADALRLVQAEQTPVHLARDRISAEQVVEEPLLAQLGDVCAEDAKVERPEVVGLIHGHEEVLNHQRLELKVAVLRRPACGRRIVRPVRIPEYVAAIDDAAHAAHLGILHEPLAVEPALQAERDVDRVDLQVKHGVVGVDRVVLCEVLSPRLVAHGRSDLFHLLVVRALPRHAVARGDGGSPLDLVGALCAALVRLLPPLLEERVYIAVCAARDKDVLEADLALLPLGHDGALEDDGDARLCGEVVCDLACDPLLQIQCIERGKHEREEGGGADDDEDGGGEAAEREEGADVVGVEAAEAADGEPLEADAQARPESLCDAQQILFGWTKAVVLVRRGFGARGGSSGRGTHGAESETLQRARIVGKVMVRALCGGELGGCGCRSRCVWGRRILRLLCGARRVRVFGRRLGRRRRPGCMEGSCLVSDDARARALQRRRVRPR